MRRHHNGRRARGKIGRCGGAVVGLGKAVVLGEVVQGVLVVVEKNAVAVTKFGINFDHLADRAVIKIKSVQV